MEATRVRRPEGEQKKHRELLLQVKAGRMALLILVAVSLLNQLLLLLKVNYHFLFSTAMPYYLNWIAKYHEGSAAGALKVIAFLLSCMIYFLYIGCWLLSAQRRDLLKTALLLYGADTVLLLIFALIFVGKPVSCLLELLTHLVALAILYNAHRCHRQLRRMSKKRKPAPAPSDKGDSYEIVY